MCVSVCGAWHSAWHTGPSLNEAVWLLLLSLCWHPLAPTGPKALFLFGFAQGFGGCLHPCRRVELSQDHQDLSPTSGFLKGLRSSCMELRVRTRSRFPQIHVILVSTFCPLPSLPRFLLGLRPHWLCLEPESASSLASQPDSLPSTILLQPE